MTLAQDYPLIVLGAGGHARVLADTLRQCNRNVLGVTDIDPDKNETLYGFEVLGNDEYILGKENDQIRLINGIGAIPYHEHRWNLEQKFKTLGYIFESVISLHANISSQAMVSSGVQIMAGAVVQAGVELERGVVVNTGSLIDHDCILQSDSWISPGVTICGDVIIESRAYIGAGSTILQGVSIGAGAIVGAGSVITKSISAGERIVQRSKNVG